MKHFKSVILLSDWPLQPPEKDGDKKGLKKGIALTNANEVLLDFTLSTSIQLSIPLDLEFFTELISMAFKNLLTASFVYERLCLRILQNGNKHMYKHLGEATFHAQLDIANLS
jgi:hypothetical protein